MPPVSEVLKHLRSSDLRAAVQLATGATQGIAHITEEMSQAVWGTLGVPSGQTAQQTRGITGLVFKSVQGITSSVGKGLGSALAALEPYLGPSTHTSTTEREAVLAALNGVMGDHLMATGSPLTTPMTLRHQGQPLNWQAMPKTAAVTRKVLLLVHGLCMNDLQWGSIDASGQQYDHGHHVAQLGYTPIYLRYNTGLHTSTNGHALAAQLEQLYLHWPQAINELSIVAHSMGGLVTRSAVHTAQQAEMAWPAVLKNIVFLGTPHHGAPLEKAGHGVDILLSSTPYSKPFAKLGQLRSAGITDLRYGHVREEDWQGKDRFRSQPDTRQHLPLPSGVGCFTVAGSTAAARSPLAERLLGDGLVTLPSALGQHADAARTLEFTKTAQHVAYRTHHMQLLSSVAVGDKIAQWLQS
jgi:pimeloyl-ACP methyl ester carboxylesterase